MADVPARYQGDFVAWSGGSLLIGEGSGSIAPHAHYAIQIAFGWPSGLRVQLRGGTWEACAGALVPSRAAHSIDVSACEWSGVIFVEPETAAGRALAARMQDDRVILPDEDVLTMMQRLGEAWRVQQDRDVVEAVCLAFVRTITQTTAPAPSDPRVLRAIDYIRRHLDAPITLAAVAGVAHLSPGRFRHLFVAETGMPLRTYVLWRRLLQVWTLLMEGGSLSGAAHAVGFADAAHLSRTARSMFGLAPSMLQMSGPLSRRARGTQHP